MPTYALLGATGATGKAIIRCLLSSPPPDLRLNIFVRSRSKLLASFPDLDTSSKFPVKITEGSITDDHSVQTCLADANIIFACIGSNESFPGTSASYDTASAIVKALQSLHSRLGTSEYTTPTILQLRAEPLNPVLAAHSPVMTSILHFCLYYTYTDLERGCALYEPAAKQTPGLLEYIFVDPPGIHDADGTECTGYKLLPPAVQETETQQGALSYADLGAAFCEIARRNAEFRGQAIAVTATGAVKTNWGTLMGYNFRGAKARIFG